jgi:hypothetical protein
VAIKTASPNFFSGKQDVKDWRSGPQRIDPLEKGVGTGESETGWRYYY